eukprot:g3129.t1
MVDFMTKHLKDHPREYFKFRIEGELARDIGGVTREVVTLVLNEIGDIVLNDDGWFKSLESLQQYADRSKHFESAKDLLHFFGQMMGSCITLQIPISFHRFLRVWPMVRAVIKGTDSDAKLVEKLCPHIGREIRRLRRKHASVENLDFDLISDAHESKPVTQENKAEFVHELRKEAKRRVDNIIKHVRRGLYSVVPKDRATMFRHFLEVANLQDIRGAFEGVLNVSKFCLSKPKPRSDGSYMWTPWPGDLEWIRAVLKKMDRKEVSLFCRFILGTNSQASLHPIRVALQDGGDDNYLPTANTCFFVLSLPNYSSPEVLERQLRKVIRLCPTGFGFV